MRAPATLFALLIAGTIPLGAQSKSSTAPTSPRTAAADTARVGNYDLEITTDDGTVTGSLTVRRAPDGLNADLTVGANKPTIKSFIREGDHYLLSGGHGSFTIIYTLRFSDDSLSGGFKMSGGLAGTVLGAIHK